MLEKMKEIIAEQLSVDADSITEASSFKDDLGADSLDLFVKPSRRPARCRLLCRLS